MSVDRRKYAHEKSGVGHEHDMVGVGIGMMA